MEDGLYRVEMAHFCAGFVVEDGRVSACAPILKKNFAFWGRFAKLVVQGREYKTMSETMAPLQLNFDARTVEPTKPFEPIPTGWYNGKIINAETKPTSKNNGDYYVELTIEVLDGAHVGRKVFDRLNLKNENQTAQEIAWKQLSAICHATGVLQVRTMQDLYGFPMQVRVVLKPPANGYDAGNDVKGYKACDKQPVATQTPPVAGGNGPAPSWAGAGGPPQPPAPTPPPAPAGPRINPPQPYQEGDVVIQPGAPSGYQLQNGQWVPYTPPAAPPPAPPAQGGWTPAPPAAATPPAPTAPPPAAAPPFAGPPAAPSAAATPPAPPAGPPGGGPPPWAR